MAESMLDAPLGLGASLDNPEARPAGSRDPHYPVSEKVTVCSDQGLYVYHVDHDQLGAGSSLGNHLAWAETKGNGDMLGLFSIVAGEHLLGGAAITYQLPYATLSGLGSSQDQPAGSDAGEYTRITPSVMGRMHIHPCYQQREFMLGDAVTVIETFYLPRTGGDDPAAAHTTVTLFNQRDMPIELRLIATVDLRGKTERDLQACFDPDERILLAHNAGKPHWARFFGSDTAPAHYWASRDEEEAYTPEGPLPDQADEQGELIGALQFDLSIPPGESHCVRLYAGFSLEGESEALEDFKRARDDEHTLKATIAHYHEALTTATVASPDDILTQGVQWAKTNMLRPLAQYPVGESATNNPGKSSNLVGRDTAWYVFGLDYMKPKVCCGMLNILAEHQRDDGLIPEYVNGITGEPEYSGFNINDNTPLFILATAHHIAVTGHEDCLERFYPVLIRAAELILGQRSDLGLVNCTVEGTGGKGMCSWRNALQGGRINGMVTELNAECYAALNAMAEVAALKGDHEKASYYAGEATTLRERINEHLVDHRTGLYIRNIDPQGHRFTQATVDMVFPLVFGVADRHHQRLTMSRLSAPDFMTSGGVRVLPEENPHFDPSEQSGLLGGVWPGVTWWFSMGCVKIHPGIAARSLQRSFEYLIRNPRMYDTVPGQFNEWSDGRTLVNRGMRLSPWAAPRYLWAAVEGLAGVHIGMNDIHVEPNLPHDWRWLLVRDLPCKQGTLSFVLTKEEREERIYATGDFQTTRPVERYERRLVDEIQTLVTGVSILAMAREGEILLFLGNSRDRQMCVPILADRLVDERATYHVSRLNSMETDWHDLGEMKGERLSRIASRIEAKGYELYRMAVVEL